MFLVAVATYVALSGPGNAFDRIEPADTTAKERHPVEREDSSETHKEGIDSALAVRFSRIFHHLPFVDTDVDLHSRDGRMLLLTHPELQAYFLKAWFALQLNPEDFRDRAFRSSPVPLARLPAITPFERMGLEALRYREIHTDPFLERMKLQSGFTRKART